MLPDRRVRLLVIAVLGLLLSGCGQGVLEASSAPGFVLEPIDGSDVKKVILTEETADLIGVETADVRTDSRGLSTLPADAVLYDPDGATWVYTSPEEHVYVRVQIKVATIKAGVAELWDGPAPMTKVVTVGVAELFGTENGVGDPE
jgi:hypothetical protein